jgi:hypothetical protein
MNSVFCHMTHSLRPKLPETRAAARYWPRHADAQHVFWGASACFLGSHGILRKFRAGKRWRTPTLKTPFILGSFLKLELDNNSMSSLSSSSSSSAAASAARRSRSADTDYENKVPRDDDGYDTEATDVDDDDAPMLQLPAAAVLLADATDTSSSSSSSASTTPGSTTSVSSRSSRGSGVLPALQRTSTAYTTSTSKAKRRARREAQLATITHRRPAKRKTAKKTALRRARRRLDTRECAFCETAGRPDLTALQLTTHYSDDVWVQTEAFDDELIGPEEHGIEHVFAHMSCLMWAPRVFWNRDTETWENVRAEVQRGDNALLKCFVCGLLGAVTGCGYEPCKRTAHYSCLLTLTDPADQKWHFDGDNYVVWCPEHAPEHLHGLLAQVEPPHEPSEPEPQPQPETKAVEEEKEVKMDTEITTTTTSTTEERLRKFRYIFEEPKEPVPGEAERKALYNKLFDEEYAKYYAERAARKTTNTNSGDDGDDNNNGNVYEGPLTEFPGDIAFRRYIALVPKPLDAWDKCMRRANGVDDGERRFVAMKCPVVSESDDDSDADTAPAAEAAPPLEEEEDKKQQPDVEMTAAAKAAAEAQEQRLAAEAAEIEAAMQQFMVDPTVDATTDRYMRWDLEHLSPSLDVAAFLQDTEAELAAMCMHTQPLSAVNDEDDHQ